MTQDTFNIEQYSLLQLIKRERQQQIEKQYIEYCIRNSHGNRRTKKSKRNGKRK